MGTTVTPDVWAGIASLALVLALLALIAGATALLILTAPAGGGDE